MISGVMPGTAVKFPAVIPAKSAGRDSAGRPALVAAGTTRPGRKVATLLVRMET